MDVFKARSSTVDEPAMTEVAPIARPNTLHNAIQYVSGLLGVVVANRYDGHVPRIRTAN